MTVVPGKSIVVTVQVSHRGPWTLSLHSNRIGYLQPDDRPISVQAGDAELRRQLPRQRGA